MLPWLLTVLALTVMVVASPAVISRGVFSLPISRHFNFSTPHNLLKHDQARAKSLNAFGPLRGSADRHAEVIGELISNQFVYYTASVGVGNPATSYDLIVDTGSSNTWVGASKAYIKTGTSVQTANKVAVTYGSGSFSGNEFTDTVTIANGLVISGQSIGVASTSTGFDNVDGIIGLGPLDLTIGTLSPATTSSIPTVLESAYSMGIIPSQSIGIFFQPPVENNVVNGEITWGGADPSKYTGPVNFAPLTQEFPASEFWGVDASIRYGKSPKSAIILPKTAGIVDTGTTLILIATNAFAIYSLETGGVEDIATGLLRITPLQFDQLQSLFFDIGGVSYELTANAQIWPPSLNSAIGGDSAHFYLIVGDIGYDSGQGLDFITGMAFLERYYSIFDTTNQRIGFASTPFTRATTN